LRTHTTAACSPFFQSFDTLTLNGVQEDVTGARTQACFRELRALRAVLEEADPSIPTLSRYPLRIVSENNFPTAAGLASSAAGFAALVRAIADLFELKQTPTELSRIARQGSGSACRSLFGGYVAWEMGSDVSGQDSLAVQIAPASHWPTMRALILVVSAAKKGVSSTTGMQTTVSTSSLFPIRASTVVPKRMEEMIAAVKAKDFPAFARLTMKDSNSFHATCLDTEPPIFYMNDVSRAAVRVVEGINEAAGRPIAAYTFDAGPNAVIYFEEANADAVAGVIKEALGALDGWKGNGENIVAKKEGKVDAKALETLKEGVSRVILTGVGEGPISVKESLIGEDGEPVKK
jgi:diphosphomevalonate decarboxylase